MPWDFVKIPKEPEWSEHSHCQPKMAPGTIAYNSQEQGLEEKSVENREDKATGQRQECQPVALYLPHSKALSPRRPSSLCRSD